MANIDPNSTTATNTAAADTGTGAAAPAITTEGEPNHLPPAAPGVQLQPPTIVIELREWFERHIPNSVHSQDTQHYNEVQRLFAALVAKLHSKYPPQA